MIKANSLVLYKNTLALVISEEKGKFSVKYRSALPTASKGAQFSEQSVRAKDFIFLHEGPSSLEKALEKADKDACPEDEMYNLESAHPVALQIKECWELLSSDEETAALPQTLEELSSLFYGTFNADESYFLYLCLKNTIYFSQLLKEQLNGKLLFVPRTKEEIDSMVKKANLKGKEAELREAFIARLKARKLDLPEDGVYMGDVEALALGKTDKSRTLHDAHIKETAESAHKVLLETGIWDITRNPYPLRWGLSMQSATEGLSSPPEDEERTKVSGTAWAIDSEWSADPDDAVAFDGEYLWVHIADPASTVMPDSSIDKNARARGATLYIPEGASRMLCEDSLSDYALGLKEISYALSFKIKLNPQDAVIEDCEVLKTIVDVKRLTYKDADEKKDTPELKPLFDIALANIEKRKKSGSVQIDIPEVHINIEEESKRVQIIPEVHFSSQDMIREMMLLAGEGAARFAFKNNIPFPFVSQDAPAMPAPEDIPSGLAGQFKIRRCMRRRSVGVTPSMHCVLGLAMYSQVTSPLRRYGDLIAHEQLRAFLDGRPLLDKDTMLMRISEGDAASSAAHKAERKSCQHWTLVYLLQNPEWTGDAVCVDLGGRQPQWFIPSLGMETYMNANSPVELNAVLKVKPSKINLSELSVEFTEA